jgi:hypothetical protein
LAKFSSIKEYLRPETFPVASGNSIRWDDGLSAHCEGVH